jgi:hypothetical protein
MNVKDKIDRRSFLKVAGMSVGIGVVYQFAPMLVRHAQAGTVTDFFKQVNGESPQSFSFAQFSDPHVGFQGPPDPLEPRRSRTRWNCSIGCRNGRISCSSPET